MEFRRYNNIITSARVFIRYAPQYYHIVIIYHSLKTNVLLICTYLPNIIISIILFNKCIILYLVGTNDCGPGQVDEFCLAPQVNCYYYTGQYYVLQGEPLCFPWLYLKWNGLKRPHPLRVLFYTLFGDWSGL